MVVSEFEELVMEEICKKINCLASKWTIKLSIACKMNRKRPCHRENL